MISDKLVLGQAAGRPAKEQDPVRYEILFNRLWHTCNSQREKARRVSASTVVRDCGEILICLCAPNGDSVITSQGVLLHVNSVTRMIRYMLANGWPDNPGIKEGDHFLNSDPHIGGMHAPDQIMATPIFWQGRLVGWVGSMSHTNEIGARTAGGQPGSARTRFEEGLLLSCLRIAERDVLQRDVHTYLERSVRTPKVLTLDLKAKMTGMIRARQEFKELIREYGADYWLSALDGYIADGRASARRKISMLPDGVYFNRTTTDAFLPGEDDPPLLVTQVKMTIDGDRLTFDLEGSSPQVQGPYNGTTSITEGCIFCALSQQLFYDCKYNSGSIDAMQIEAPPGSLFNCDLHMATNAFIAAAGLNLQAVVNLVVSSAYYCAGMLEEVQSAHPTLSAINYGGVDDRGREFAITILEGAASGMGAQALRDGESSSYAQFNPEGDMADIESWESTGPLVFLSRLHHADSGGFGKFRGGAGFESIHLVAHTDRIAYGARGFSMVTHPTPGLHGGYPSCCSFRLTVHNPDLAERIAARRPLPHCYEEVPQLLGGDYQEHRSLKRSAGSGKPYRRGDVITIRHHGGGGYGDPLLREPSLVAADLRNGLTSPFAARHVYGVAVDEATLTVDEAATAECRAAIRRQRLAQGVPAARYIREQRARLLRGDLPVIPRKTINTLLSFSPTWAAEFRAFWSLPADFVKVPEQRDTTGESAAIVANQQAALVPPATGSDDATFVAPLQDNLRLVRSSGQVVVECTECGHRFGHHERNWKLAALVYDRDPKEVYPSGGRAGDANVQVFREFYCPGCGTLLDVEPAPPGFPFAFTVRLKIGE